jgi:hypothetical protein
MRYPEPIPYDQPLEMPSTAGPRNSKQEIMDLGTRMLERLITVRRSHPSVYFKKDIQGTFSLSDFEMAVDELSDAYVTLWTAANTSSVSSETKMQSMISGQRADIIQLKNKLTSDASKYEEKIRRLAQDKQKSNERLEYDLSSRIKELQMTLNKTRADYEARMSMMREQLIKEFQNAKDQMMDETRAKQDHQVDDLVKQLRNQTAKNDYIRISYEEKIASMKSLHEKDVKNLKDDLMTIRAAHRDEVTATSAKYEEQIAALQEEHQRSRSVELSRITGAHWEELKQLQEKHEEQLGQIAQQNAALESNLTNSNKAIDVINKKQEDTRQKEIEKLKQLHSKALQDMRKDFSLRIQDMEAKHSDQINDLESRHESALNHARGSEKSLISEVQKENQRLKRAFVDRENKRDRVKVPTDREIASHFSDLLSEIDDLSRIPWDSSKENSWPAPSRAINDRRMKQYVVQNAIWAILEEKIFKSPFRLFGRIGKQLEQKWIDLFAPGMYIP